MPKLKIHFKKISFSSCKMEEWQDLRFWASKCGTPVWRSIDSLNSVVLGFLIIKLEVMIWCLCCCFFHFFFLIFRLASCAWRNLKHFKYFTFHMLLKQLPWRRKKTKRHLFLIHRAKTFIWLLLLEEVLFGLEMSSVGNVTGHTLTLGIKDDHRCNVMKPTFVNHNITFITPGYLLKILHFFFLC
jgi:hypothetical protein